MNQIVRKLYWPDGISLIKDSEEQREKIANLKPGILKKKIAGVIIVKHDARSFADKKNPSQTRWQLNFTLRDSPMDFINVICWGGEAFIKDIENSCRIGNNVEVTNVIIQSKQFTEAEEKYNPWTPSDFNIIANEPHAKIALYNGADMASFTSIAFLPVKDDNDYYKLGDIIANGHNLSSLHVNLLAAVRNAGYSKELVTKNGKTIRRRELQIYDETCPCFTLTIWDIGLMEMADGWKECETVLFLADVKVHFDEYKKRMVAVCDGKTIITVNPDVPDAHVLYSYIGNTGAPIGEHFDDQENDGILLEDIQTTFTANTLQLWIDESTDQCVVHGIINGCISNFNIDSSHEFDKNFILRCNICKYQMESEFCPNLSCSNGQRKESSVIKQLNLRLDVSDVTGGIQNLRLKGNIAEKIIGFTVYEILGMNEAQRTELKWKFLMERYKIYFKCSRHRDDKRKSLLDILWIQPSEDQPKSNHAL